MIRKDETREQAVKRMEEAGNLDPECPGCRQFYEHPRLEPFAPSHRGSSACQSGKRPHCTCDSCF